MVKPLPAGCRLTAVFDASLQKLITIFLDIYILILLNTVVVLPIYAHTKLVDLPYVVRSRSSFLHLFQVVSFP